MHTCPHDDADREDRLNVGDIQVTPAELIDARREGAAEVTKFNPEFSREDAFRWALDGVCEQYRLGHTTAQWLLEAGMEARA